MKKTIALLLSVSIIVLSFSSCSCISLPEIKNQLSLTTSSTIQNKKEVEETNAETLPNEKTKSKPNERKAVWITYYELEKFISVCKTSKEFEKKMSKIFKEIKKFGLNTVTVQVRSNADAIYNSKYFPTSKYCFGKEGIDLLFDPLEIIVKTAHSENLFIEAWINPYRVSQSNVIDKLSKNNIAKKWYSNKKTKSYVYIGESTIYFNPAVEKVQNLIVSGVKEICENYNIDSIHFDDYFYPTTEKDIDKKEYKDYKKSGGLKSLKNWRIENVNKMIKSVYSGIKSVNKNIEFGISPAGNIENNKKTLFADVEEWVTNDGYIDYICPQIYYGFKNEVMPFMFTVKKWIQISNCKIYVGLPLYKSGKADEYASSNNKTAINEFKNNSNIISRQIKYLRGLDDVSGFYIFSFSFLFESEDKTIKEEVENIKNIMIK